MSNELVKSKTEVMMIDLENTNKMCDMLMQTPHYKKMGSEGIFAIVEKAKSIGINPMDALNGGLFYVQGKVELTSAMMNQLIRGGKYRHSITKDKKSDETICILHGKRADNGDTWVESFSIEDAKQAGIYRNQWIKYPKDMLFARALSRLARQLFPDVIKGCYVQGEIADSEPLNCAVDDSVQVVEPMVAPLTDDEADYLNITIGDNEEYRTVVMNHIKKHYDAEKLIDMPRDIYEKILPVAERKFNEQLQSAVGE